MRDRFVEVMTGILDTQPSVCLVLAEISAGLFESNGASARHPDRIINVGIREQLMIGVAAGMAKEGMRPVVHTYAPFLIERPFEQVKLDLSHQGLGAVLVSVGGSVDASAEGRTHQAPGDVALVTTLPDWTVFVPGHRDEAESALRHAVGATGNFYVRLSDLVNPHAVETGETGWTVVREGKTATVIAVGHMLDSVLEATHDLDVTVIYTNRPHPVNEEVLFDGCNSTNVILVEPYLAGTGLSGLASALNTHPHRFLAIGFPRRESRHYGTPTEHLAQAGLDPDGIGARIREFIDGGD